MRDMSVETPGYRAPDRRVLALVGAAALIFVVGLTWSKWMPYAAKIDVLSGTRAWEGGALVDTAREASSWWTGAWAFTVAYTEAVWKALLVGLLLAAAIDAFLPHAWLRRVLGGRGTLTGAATAGAVSLPSMMCTCCASPVAVSLRRTGVPTSSAVAYWLGNPVLNPAVLVFLALVGPWQWAATRLAVGIALVLGAALVAAWLTGERRTTDTAVLEPDRARQDGQDGNPLVRFGRSLARLTLTLIPEYLLVVFLVGAGAHLLSWDAPWLVGGWGVLALAVVALLMVIPTGGEIPVLLALAAVGASTWVLGLVLIALPAISLPSLLMVGQTLTWRVTGATALFVAAAGVVAGGVLLVLG